MLQRTHIHTHAKHSYLVIVLLLLGTAYENAESRVMEIAGAKSAKKTRAPAFISRLFLMELKSLLVPKVPIKRHTKERSYCESILSARLYVALKMKTTDTGHNQKEQRQGSG